MDNSLQKKTLLLIIATVILISAGSIFYFIGTISNLQDDHYEEHARELADIVALSIDTEMLESFKTQVASAYDSAENKVSNDHMGTNEYAIYMSQFDYLKSTEEYKHLYKILRKLRDSADVDSFYLLYVDVPTQSAVYLIDVGDNNICYPGSFDYLKGEDLAVLKDPDMRLVVSITDPNVYGDIVGSGQPIYDGAGNVIAYVSVDISLEEISKSRRRLYLNTVLTIILFSLVLGAVSMYLSGQLLLKPITSHQELVEESENLKRENEALATKARAAEKIAELTGSIQSLMTNMPAMTFSKDAGNGRYVACNQMFAEYAHKKNPSEVVGHSDFEIFDKETAKHFVEDDKIAMSMDEPHIFREDVPDAAGNMRYLQTTKLKFTDANGRLCILGMAIDISELVLVKKENEETKDAYDQAVSEKVTYSSIARALSSDYTFLYYVNINTDRYRQYTSESGRLDMAVEFEAEDFFGQSAKDIRLMLYEEDQDRIINVFTKENILKVIEDEGIFALTYRLNIDGKPVYFELKAVRMEGDEDHIIIGVHNIDAQTKAKEAAEHLREEQITYERIAALSGKYICIYTVDPKTDHFVEFAKTNEDYSLMIPKEGEDFFEKTRYETEQVIYSDDRDRVLSVLTKENILKETDRTGIFSIRYRLMINGAPKYVNFKAVLIDEKDGKELIVGVSDIDARVKLEQEYADNLATAQNKANYDVLTGLMNKHSYVDAEQKINEMIEAGSSPVFAIVVCDVNGLKQVNDTYGHKAGDEFIIKAGQIISQIFEGGWVFRIGGDEFAVIMKGESVYKMDDMLKKMHESNINNRSNGGVVIACGASRYLSIDRNMEKVFERADKAMYENKQMLKGM